MMVRSALVATVLGIVFLPLASSQNSIAVELADVSADGLSDILVLSGARVAEASADFHADIIGLAPGGNGLWLMRGDGGGEFGPPIIIDHARRPRRNGRAPQGAGDN